MITRKEYMENSSELFNEYYLQFATPTVRSEVNSIKHLIFKSTDKHFNDINLSIWDRISRIAFHELCKVNFKINGSRSVSLSDGVCAAKSYARSIIK